MIASRQKTSHTEREKGDQLRGFATGVGPSIAVVQRVFAERGLPSAIRTWRAPCRVQKHGCVAVPRGQITYVSTTLAGELVGLRELQPGRQRQHDRHSHPESPRHTEYPTTAAPRQTRNTNSSSGSERRLEYAPALAGPIADLERTAAPGSTDRLANQAGRARHQPASSRGIEGGI